MKSESDECYKKENKERGFLVFGKLSSGKVAGEGACEKGRLRESPSWCQGGKPWAERTAVPSQAWGNIVAYSEDTEEARVDKVWQSEGGNATE